MASTYAPLPAARSSTSSRRSSNASRRKSRSGSGSGLDDDDDDDLTQLELSGSSRGRQDTLSAFAFPGLTGLGIPLTLSDNLDGSGLRGASKESGKKLGVVNGACASDPADRCVRLC
jgi:hypothetical protein